MDGGGGEPPPPMGRVLLEKVRGNHKGEPGTNVIMLSGQVPETESPAVFVTGQGTHLNDTFMSQTSKSG